MSRITIALALTTLFLLYLNLDIMNAPILEARPLWNGQPDGALSGEQGGDRFQEERRRPVVMVHGFGASADAWINYLGPDGYLASAGLQGFAVGDGQVEGVMNTGNLLEPASRTNTIAENARIVGEYIDNVRELTGASQVDLIAHSMGGLISRYYIDRFMDEGEVAQLIMLGSPQLGTDCANLPASAGLFLPATLELRPSYVTGIFNRQITHRRGVPFSIVSGVPIEQPIQSPCTAVPSDIVISRESASGIPADISYVPVLHTDLNLSREVFEEFVLPRLLRDSAALPDEPDPEPAAAGVEPLQFSRVYSGHLAPGESEEITINIDAVTVASFALFDTTRSLTVTVTGASGQVIQLSPAANGLTVIDDPETLFYLGYGFNNPRPGPWRVAVQTTAETPAGGAEYALTAQYVGGAALEASTSQLLPPVGEPVELIATLTLGGASLPIDEAVATIRSESGVVETIPLGGDATTLRATWEPPEPGLYSVDIAVRATTPDGNAVDRAAFLAIEAQPRPAARYLLWFGAGAGIGLLLVGGIAWWRRRQPSPPAPLPAQRAPAGEGSTDTLM